MYAAIDIDTKFILDVTLFGRHGTNPAAAFLSGLAEKHDLSNTVFLVDQFDVPSSDDYRIDPVTLRVNAYLDAYAADSKFDWVTASVLQAVLPALCSGDVESSNVTRALRKTELEASPKPIERCLEESEHPTSVFRTALE